MGSEEKYLLQTPGQPANEAFFVKGSMEAYTDPNQGKQDTVRLKLLHSDTMQHQFFVFETKYYRTPLKDTMLFKNFDKEDAKSGATYPKKASENSSEKK